MKDRWRKTLISKINNANNNENNKILNMLYVWNKEKLTFLYCEIIRKSTLFLLDKLHFCVINFLY